MPSLVYKRKNNQDSLSNVMASGNSFIIIHVYVVNVEVLPMIWDCRGTLLCCCGCTGWAWKWLDTGHPWCDEGGRFPPWSLWLSLWWPCWGGLWPLFCWLCDCWGGAEGLAWWPSLCRSWKFLFNVDSPGICNIELNSK